MSHLLEELGVLDRHLYALVEEAMKYRRALQGEVLRLRVGDKPHVVLARLHQWAPTLQAIRRLARGLSLNGGPSDGR